MNGWRKKSDCSLRILYVLRSSNFVFYLIVLKWNLYQKLESVPSKHFYSAASNQYIVLWMHGYILILVETSYISPSCREFFSIFRTLSVLHVLHYICSLCNIYWYVGYFIVHYNILIYSTEIKYNFLLHWFLSWLINYYLLTVSFMLIGTLLQF